MREKTFGTIPENIQKTVSMHGWVYCSNERVKFQNFPSIPLTELVRCIYFYTIKKFVFGKCNNAAYVFEEGNVLVILDYKL